MSKTINADARITLYADADYYYDVFSGESIGIGYKDVGNHVNEIQFATIEEMEAVAKMMLKLVKLGKEINE